METLPQSIDGGLERLLEQGFALYRRAHYLVVAVPYVNDQGVVKTGLLVDNINFDEAGVARQLPVNHQFYFIGSQPFDGKGRPLFSGAGATCVPLFDGKVASFQWSWKPKDASGVMRDYLSLEEKVVSYTDHIGGPAEVIDPSFKTTPFVALQADIDSPFPFEDMNSARADLGELNKFIETESIAIVGAGGTGSYVFDLITKSNVKNVRVFDFDVMDLHNAFRSPGATTRQQMGQPKIDVLEQRYRGWHKGAQFIEAKLDDDSGPLLDGVTFAFIAVDKIAARRSVAKILLARGIPFIIVGMGLHHGHPGLFGAVETCIVNDQTTQVMINEFIGDHLVDLGDEYDKNIQTVELNALNAALAVFMFKKYRGYYASSRVVNQLLFSTKTEQLDRGFQDEDN